MIRWYTGWTRLPKVEICSFLPSGQRHTQVRQSLGQLWTKWKNNSNNWLVEKKKHSCFSWLGEKKNNGVNWLVDQTWSLARPACTSFHAKRVRVFAIRLNFIELLSTQICLAWNFFLDKNRIPTEFPYVAYCLLLVFNCWLLFLKITWKFGW